MRIILFLLFSGILLSQASNSYSQKTVFTLHMKSASIKEVCEELENKSNFRFIFAGNAKNIINKKVDFIADSQDIEEILENILPNTGLTYTILDNQVVIYKSEEAISNENEQSEQVLQDRKKTVTGRITDKKGETIIGANIVEKGTGNGVVSNVNGDFSINTEPDATITITYIGYISQEISVKNRENIEIILDENVDILDDVVVIGYGIQKKKLLTGATINVTGDKIQKLNTTNTLGALQSQAPGLNIVQGNGQPGTSYVVNIRGMGTIGSYNPLYVVDGVTGGSISSLNPADIESIDVLKDAASAAIYGARAANGVILITTKQGVKGKPRISYDAYYGIQNPVMNGVKSISATKYMELMNTAQETAGNGSKFYDFEKLIPTQYKLIQSGEWNGTDWLKETINEDAPNVNHAVNIVGGSDASSYSLGFSQSSEEGTLGWPRQTYYDRTTLRVNTNYSLWRDKNRDILKIGENATVSKFSSRGVSTGNIYSNHVRNFLKYTPLLPAYNNKGGFYGYENQLEDEWNWSEAVSNPLEKMTIGDSKNETYRVQSNVWAEFSPIENLKFKSTYGYHFNLNSSRSYSPTYYLSPKDFRDKDIVGQDLSYSYNWTWENTINYVRKIKNHSFDLLLGQALEKAGYGQDVGANKKISLFPNMWEYAYINNTESDITPENVSVWGGRPSENQLMSFFGRLNYSHKDTYMASLILRADGSSNFARGHRWGYFPSASAGWVVTNESFMERFNDYVDFLKLRASWGQNGNCSISNFQYLATISLGGFYTFNDDQVSTLTGAYPDILPNKNLSWEISEQTNIGLDSRFLRSRLGVSLDWYRKTTKDWLVKAPALASYGTGNPVINGGSVRNQGVEMTISWDDQLGDVRYGANFNMAHNVNEVTSIKNQDGIIHGPTNFLSQNTEEFFRVEVGHPMGYFYGYQTAGIFQNQNEIDNWINEGKAVMQGKDVQPGDVKFIDQNSDGLFNDEDKVEIGNPHPKYTVGLNLNVAYKGFDLSVTGSGAFGMQVIQSYRSFAYYETDNYTNNMIDKYWTGEGSTNKFPRFTHGKHVNLQKISDIWLENADYLKIRNITFGYDFKNIMKSVKLFSQLRLYASLQNFITFSGYSGMDPEVGYGGGYNWTSGIDLGYYPNPKRVIFGINIKF